MRKIGIDAGHGGRDPGATGNGRREKDIALDYSLALSKELKRRGYGTVLTRDRDAYLSLGRRSTLLNNHGVDIVISLHLNSFNNPQANGIETFYWHSSTKGKRLASEVQSRIKRYWKSDRGIKTKNLHMTREPKAPAILIELGFISNAADLTATLNSKTKIVSSIADGVDAYFGKPVTTPQPKPTPVVETYRVRHKWNDVSSQVGSYTNLEQAKKKADQTGLNVFNSKGSLIYPPPHWADIHYISLNNKGIKIQQKRYNDPMTRGEVMALLDRAIKK